VSEQSAVKGEAHPRITLAEEPVVLVTKRMADDAERYRNTPEGKSRLEKIAEARKRAERLLEQII
jgi:hypothetical protein